MNKNLIIIIIIIVLALAGFFVWQSQNKNENINVISDNTETSTKAEVDMYRKDEVATHNTPTDCWFIIENKVYDITKYIASDIHPGTTEALIPNCGKDATTSFQSRGEKQEPHSDKAKGYLENFYIGELATN